MQYKICPKCGSHLDFGETCSCGQKDGAALLEQDDPRNDLTANIISSLTQNVNTRRLAELKAFIDENGIPARDAVAVIHDKYPSFDKYLMSKLMKPEVYGVVLHPDGWVYLNDAYPNATFADSPSAAPKKPERRRLPCRIYGRLSARDYDRLQQYASEDGYLTIQEWLHAQVTEYLQTKEAEHGEHT